MPVGTRRNADWERVPAYLLPSGDNIYSATGAGFHVATDASLAALEATRAQYARDAQAEHEAKKTGGDPRWHKAEAKRYERLMRAYRLVIAWLDGTTADLQAHRFPLEMAEEIDAAFRHNSIVTGQPRP